MCKARCPGGRLAWTRGGAGTMEVLFRPNDVRLVAPEDSELKGEVSQVFFLGDRTRVHLTGVADRVVVAETTEHREFRAGQKVGLRIDPATLLVLEG